MWYLLVVCILTASLAPLRANAATLFTSPGGSPSSNCTQASPCSIARSLALLAGGDTLIMAGGDYASGFGHPYNANIPSGSAGAPTIIQAAQGQTPIIRSVTMPGGTGPGLQYITFDGITVDGGGVGFGNGDHISFLNGVSRNTRDAQNVGQGIAITGGKHDIRIANSQIHGADLYGFYVSWFDSVIEDNLIYGNNSYGLHFFCGQYPDGTRPCAKPGGDPFVPYVANNVVRRNRIYNNGYCDIPGTTCLIGSGTGAIIGAGPNNQFYNNVIFNNNNGGIQVYPGCIDCLFYNNTIWNNTGPGITLDTGGAGCCNNGPPRPVIKNNILYQNSAPIADQGAVSPDISNNFTTDPSFFNLAALDFHLQPGSAAKNYGTPALYPPTDYAGIPQNQGGAPSAGAYEFPEGGPVPIALAASPSSVIAGGTVTATWNNIASPTGSDSIKLYTPAAGDGAPLASVNTGGGASGTVFLTIPGGTTPGTYQLRLFNGAGTATKLATSNNFTVTSAGNPPTAAPVHVAQNGGNDSRDCPTGENPASPLLTITRACACMTIPGKHMIVHAGIYVEKVNTSTCPITGGNGPSFADATVIETFGTDDVTIKLPSSGVGVFFQNGANDKYIIVKGSIGHRLVLDGDNKVNSNVMGIYPGAHHLWFQWVEVKNTVGGYEAVYASNTDTIRWSDSLIHHAGLAGLGLDNGASNWMLERTMIHNNGSGGIVQYAGTVTSLTIKESTVKNNTGHGIELGTSNNFNILNTLTYNNIGKGLWLKSGAVSPKIFNSTFYGNSAQGVHCEAGVTGALMTNAISFGNGTNLLNACNITIAMSNTNGTDPLFVNAAAEDFRSADLSPSIDHGEVIPTLTIALDGTPRPVGPNYDQGTYERTTAPPQQGLDVTTLRPSKRGRSMFMDTVKR
jgi:hypothetical protein